MTGKPTVDELCEPDLGVAWMHFMRAGEFENAWRISDRLLDQRRGQRCDDMPRHLQWVWNGGDVAGKRVLVRCYHGLGDTIHFARYAKRLHDRAREVIFWAQPELIPLFRSVAGIDRIMPLHAGQPDIDYDIDVEVMELPYLFRSSLNDLPAKVPYVQVERPIRRTVDGLAVGFVWRTGEWEQETRSIPTRLLYILERISNVRFYILQQGDAIHGLPEGFGIDLRQPDISSLAKVMNGLDLIVSVDSMPAHLAGALGLPTWMLLSQPADWRWLGEERHNTPWYPSMRLFRQPEPGNWETVLREVVGELASFSQRSSGSIRARWPHKHPSASFIR